MQRGTILPQFSIRLGRNGIVEYIYFIASCVEKTKYMKALDFKKTANENPT